MSAKYFFMGNKGCSRKTPGALELFESAAIMGCSSIVTSLNDSHLANYSRLMWLNMNYCFLR